MEVAEDSEMQHATTLGIFDSVDYACHIEDTPNHGAFRDMYVQTETYIRKYVLVRKVVVHTAPQCE